ncbi:hypothetical protein NW752_003086 [Fusarium irregulare]|uniref:Uncharacterized protein n=1 Tax=Fusarium irregulare TaxID=2494466 RepID=A0A9W8UGI2_9HYPO|nr:hypothetical protein NW766_000755 [Fusarium irregulare]KAJ4025613.1 hypothetical protein NW752_003086 [Fusarium irregulare]
MVQLREGGTEHRDLPSNVGSAEARRPRWIGPNPSLKDRRLYARSYLSWANGHDLEWEKVNRGGAENLTAQVMAEKGETDIGQDRWDCLVDGTLWNISFHNVHPKPERAPLYPWKAISNTEGGISTHYRSLRKDHLARKADEKFASQEVEGTMETKDGQKAKVQPRGGLQQNSVSAGPSASRGPGPTQGPGEDSALTLPVGRPRLLGGKTPAALDHSIPSKTKPLSASPTLETPALGITDKGMKKRRLIDVDDGFDEDPHAVAKRQKLEAKKDKSGVEPVPNEIPEPASPKDQIGVELWQHGGQLYRQPPTAAPDLHTRRETYRKLCFGDTAGENPFEIELPDYFDFETFVWGKDGADWDFIQDRYIKGKIKLAWGYKGGIPEKATPFEGAIDESRMASVGYVLTVGLADDHADLEVDGVKVLLVWKLILDWYTSCCKSNPKALKLFFHAYEMDSPRAGSRVPGALPPGYQGLQERIARDRSLCTAQIREIFDKGGDDMTDSLEEWLVETSTGTGLSFGDRLEMITFEWHMRTRKEQRVETWRLGMVDKYRSLLSPGSVDLGY